MASKLEGARSKLDRDAVNAGTNQLNAFINQVGGMINSNRLSPEEGQALIDLAIDVIDSALFELLQPETW